ncbi:MULTISPECIES: hypothetical protein [Chromohalobacter]|nr:MULTISPECIES: hypothetical protein [Chromohalobacter]
MTIINSNLLFRTGQQHRVRANNKLDSTLERLSAGLQSIIELFSR